MLFNCIHFHSIDLDQLSQHWLPRSQLVPGWWFSWFRGWRPSRLCWGSCWRQWRLWAWRDRRKKWWPLGRHWRLKGCCICLSNNKEMLLGFIKTISLRNKSGFIHHRTALKAASTLTVYVVSSVIFCPLLSTSAEITHGSPYTSVIICRIKF